MSDILHQRILHSQSSQPSVLINSARNRNGYSCTAISTTERWQHQK